jgi:hypothetical protein
MSVAVTAAESELLRVARAVVGLSSYSEVERLLCTAVAAPTHLGPTAMRLLQDTLGRGVSLSMLRGGGWRQERSQRLWQRLTLPPIHFHPASFQLLQWMLRTPLIESGAKPFAGKGPQSWADEALLAFALGTVADTACERVVATASRVRASALCWVAQPAALARHQALENEGPLLELSATAPLTFFLEAWQPTLAKSWARTERCKGEVVEPAELFRIGRAQEVVLGALLKAADSAKRRDLLTFLVEAGASVLLGTLKPLKADDWVASLSPTAPLRERTEARKQSAAFLKALVKLRAWDQEHRAVRFFEEEEYVKSQALVARWEILGDRGFREAERLASELENPV